MTTKEVKQPAVDDEANSSPSKQDSNKRLSEDDESNNVEEELEELQTESGNREGTATPPIPNDQKMDEDGNEESPESIKDKNPPSESPPKKRQKTYIESIEDKEKNHHSSDEQPGKDGDNPDDEDDDDDIKVIEPTPKKVSPSKESLSEEPIEDGSSPLRSRRTPSKPIRRNEELHSEEEEEEGAKEQPDGKSKTDLEKAMKPCTVKIEKLAKVINDAVSTRGAKVIAIKGGVSGREDAEKSSESSSKRRISPVKVTRTYPGPTRKVNMFSKPDGRRYMILDRATIKGMMEKGLIQPIEKDGTNQTAAYRAVVPKTKPSILRRVDSNVGLDSSPDIISSKNSDISGSQDSSTVLSAEKSPNVETLSTALTSSAPRTSSSMDASATNVRLQMPSILVKHSPSGVSQVLSNPVFVKTSVSGSAPVSENVQYVTISSGLSNKIQNGEAPSSLTVASGSFAPVLVQSVKNVPKGAVKIITPSDKSLNPGVNSGDAADGTDSDDDDKKKKFGIPTGVCKVLKSMKMYQYVDKFDSEDGSSTRSLGPPKNSHNVRWVAVPNNPGDPTPDCGPKIQRCTPPILPINVPDVGDSMERNTFEASNGGSPEDQQTSEEEFHNHYKVRELRMKQKEQLLHHRSRYSELLMTYNELASRYDEIKDVGTIRQILTDAKKFMKKDHILFFRNEMLLKDRSGTGHRYSPKFMTMLMRYYNKSPIGYRFLRQIFTLPAVRTLLNWQNKSLHMRKKKKLLASQNLELGGNEENENGDGERNPGVTPRVLGGINYYDSDSDDGDEDDKVLIGKNNSSKPNGEDNDDYIGMVASNTDAVFDVPE